jgi:hypothetical protein
MKYYHYSIFIVFALCVLAYLTGPKIPDHAQATECARNIHFDDIFGISLDCDSPEFINLANEPSKLLEEGQTRQGRPGYPLIAYTLKMFVQPFHSYLSLLWADSWRSDYIRDIDGTISALFAYALLNITLLAAVIYAMLCFARSNWPLQYQLSSAQSFGKLVLRNLWIFLPLLVLFNVPMKRFLWSPHTVVFNIAAPTFAFWIYFYLRHNKEYHPLILSIGTSIVVGLLGLVYPNFVVGLPIIGLALVQNGWNTHTSPFRKTTHILLHILSLLTAAIPFLLWKYFVEWKIGSFYEHETMGSNYVTWLFASETSLLEKAIMLVSNITRLLHWYWPLMVALLLPLTYLYYLYIKKRITIDYKDHECFFIAILIAIGFCGFYAIVGNTHYYVAYSIIPTLIIAALRSSQLLSKVSATTQIIVNLYYGLIVAGYGFWILSTPYYSIHN